MGQFTLFLSVLTFSFLAFAQIEFGSLIDDSIQKQNTLAEEIRTSDQLAKNVDSDDFDEEGLEELPMKETYSTFVTDPNAAKAKPQDAAASQQNVGTRGPASEKEFAVKLKPATGTDSALKYFPNLRKRSKKDRELAKAESLETGLGPTKSIKKKTGKKSKTSTEAKLSSSSKNKKSTVSKNTSKKSDKKKSRKLAAAPKKKKTPKGRTTASSTTR